MLKLCGIHKSFAHKPVLKDINLSAKPGELTAFLGKNGAGKSTLLSIITGALPLDGGHIYLFDQEITHKSAQERALMMAILKQDPKMMTASSLTVEENLILASLKGAHAKLAMGLSEKRRASLRQHLRDLHIDDALLDAPMNGLSGGQRQIIAFAMAVMKRPSLLLLDEPTAALDEQASHTLMTLIKELIQKWSIPAIMICHDKALVDQFADAVHELKDGILNTVDNT